MQSNPTLRLTAQLSPLIGLLLSMASSAWSQPSAGFLQMTNGYFWDPAVGQYFVPRGMAYQIWNPPVGANQSTNQVNYDLVEFKKMYANSVRVELTWGQVEVGLDQYDWTRPDFLIQRAEALGLKLFVIIGYQYPPAWFPQSWRGINNEGLREDVVQCLANSSPDNALNCLPATLAQFLQATNTPQDLAQILNCFVTGAKAGGVSNILECLETKLTPAQLSITLPYLISDVINYEDPRARAVYSNYIGAVTARYKDSPAIGGWILGNEYAYFDLWESRDAFLVHRFLGYDPISLQSFHNFLRSLYQTNISALNTNWATNYADFDSVVMPLVYPSDRHYPGYQDLIQWRKSSIGNYVASGAVAALKSDPNHLRTYAMVGGIFDGKDANFACEDAHTIVTACRDAGAPLHFWSINNYPWASLGSEMRSAAFGIAKYQAQSGLPVMISETGHSSTEDFFDYDKSNQVFYAGIRQPKALPSTMWESLLGGAIGIHFFNWNDRSQFTQAYFYRERGFGIVEENRLPKHPVYDNMVRMFRQMDNIRLDQLLGGSREPAPDVLMFWSTNSDMVWPRANQENAMVWGALKRVGMQPAIIDDEAFARSAFTNAPVLLLSRAYQMDPKDLGRINSEVVAAGINVHAQADLPGQFDAYCRPNSNWPGLMRSIFGIDVSQATPGVDLIVTNDCFSPLNLVGVAPLGSIPANFSAGLSTWKLWKNVKPATAKVILTAFGNTTPSGDCPYLDPTPYSALLVQNNGSGRGKAAINPVSFGDTYAPGGPPAEQWELRYAIFHAIYRDYFGLTPAIDLSGSGSDRISSTYRVCSNGSVLIALLNEDTNTAVVNISAPTLLAGRTVEDLFQGGVLSRNSNGTLTYTNGGDDCVVLYAYSPAGSEDGSLINGNPNKLWFQDTPLMIWPKPSPFDVQVGYDTTGPGLSLSVALEQVWPHSQVFARSATTNISGAGNIVAQLAVPDSDPNDPNYLSTPEGAEYVLHATLQSGGVTVSDISVPVRLVFGVYPTQAFPNTPTAGQNYQISIAWEELPSYASNDLIPLDRAAIWDSAAAGQEHYNIVLELLNSLGSVVVSNSVLTTQGNGSFTFPIKVPTGAKGPFTWKTFAQTATNVSSHNVQESFEGYERGANYDVATATFNPTNFLAPWHSFTYPQPPIGSNVWQNEGVQLIGSAGSQSAFLVATNPSIFPYAGFGIEYDFPTPWALPTDQTKWTNYIFSYDFQESHGYVCSVEMQIKNDDAHGGAWIQYTNLYPGNGWFTLRSSLAKFLPPPNVFGTFNPSNVAKIVLNVNMLTRDVQYVGSFDNVRFAGPEINQGGGEITSVDTSANDTVGWMEISLGLSGLSVSWIGTGTLQTATNLAGAWLDITNASNPYHINPPKSRQFYRLRR